MKIQFKLESSSSRAINIVKFFIEEGIEPHRLVAAGFGENYPIDSGSGVFVKKIEGQKLN